MERRSFLSAVVGWLAALLALVLPRRGPARALSGFTPPSGPASPSPLPYRSPREPDEVWSRSFRLYRDAGLMLDEMHAHLCRTGHACLPCDDPERLRAGFSTFDDSPGAVSEEAVLWQCSLLGLRSLASRLQGEGGPAVPDSFGTSADKDAVAVLLDCLGTGGGRARLAEAYQSAGRERFGAGLGPLA
jgi:hypothetical protein